MAGVIIASLGANTSGRLLFGNAPVTAGQFISAASIAAGMLTFAPADDLANANRTFTFNVVDSAGESDATARTMTMAIGTNQPDPFVPGTSNGTAFGVGVDGTLSMSDGGGNNDYILINVSGSRTFKTLNFMRSDDNLEVSWTAGSNAADYTVLDQYNWTDNTNNNTIEEFDFGNAGNTFAGHALSDNPYNLSRTLTGGTGRDIIAGSAVSETLLGNNGDDLLFGNGGHDTLEGGNHDDLLVGGLGNDILRGGQQNDTYVFGLADGIDTIEDEQGTDRITILTGGAALSSLYAYDDDTGENAGNLVIEFNGQRITVSDHYAGNDAVELINFNGGSFAGYEFGTGDYKVSSADPDGSPRTVFENAGVSHFIAGELDTINIIGGINQNDVLIGGNLIDSLSGGAGNDLLVGGAGGDILFGGLGSDVLIGGEGADEFRFLSGDDGGPTVDDADSILDFRDSGNDVIEILGAGSGGFSIGGLSAGSQEAVFGKTADTTFGSTSERFHYDTSSNTLWYDADGSDSGFTAVALARLENGYDLQGNQITVI
jgi:Ca2+-binding RTX toxin-like protein